MSGARFRWELKQLPLMLGKVLAAMVAVAGFTMAVLDVTRCVDASLAGVLAWLLLGGAGLLAFQLLSRALLKWLPGEGSAPPRRCPARQPALLDDPRAARPGLSAGQPPRDPLARPAAPLSPDSLCPFPPAVV